MLVSTCEAEAEAAAATRARTRAPRTFDAQIREDWRPQQPQDHNVEKECAPLRPSDRHIVKRQELNLQQKQNQNWEDDERRQGDEFEHEPKNAGAEFRRPGEDLHKDIARQQAAQLVANVLVVRPPTRRRLCISVSLSGNWRFNSSWKREAFLPSMIKCISA